MEDVFSIIIAGSRDFNDYEKLKEVCDYMLSKKKETHNIIIISGGARGADKLGELYAKERGYVLQRYLANWDKDGKMAGFIRNVEMAAVADACICFWDGKSKGTKHMIETARKKKLKTKVVLF